MRFQGVLRIGIPQDLVRRPLANAGGHALPRLLRCTQRRVAAPPARGSARGRAALCGAPEAAHTLQNWGGLTDVPRGAGIGKGG